jgi:hypothetical protein
MEQPCYKCGQAIEEGIPFCPHCSAPQIRVIVAEPVPVPAIPAEPSVASASALPASATVPVLALPMSWSGAIKPCALAALVACLLMALGLNLLVAMISVGFLAVVFYRPQRRDAAIKAGTGARLGALSGLLWFAISSIYEALVVILFHKGDELRKELLAAIAQAASRSSDPQTLAVFDRLKTPEGLQFMMIFFIVFGFFMAILLASLGGALGASLFGRQKKP